LGSGYRGNPVIRVRNLSKVFTDPATGRPVQALQEIAALEFYEGELTTILGPSGCGKTTLLNIIAGFDRPTTGVAEEEGRPIEKPHPRRGVVFQEPNLFPWLTVSENVLFGPEVRGENLTRAAARAETLLAMVGLTAFKDHKPHQLSGGMKHRVAITRTLMNDPKVFLADEPFAALDEHTRRKLQADLLRLLGTTDMTVIFVTHNIEEAVYLADRIVVMTQGPGRIKEIIDVDLPRPRDRLSPGFNEHWVRIFKLLEPEV